MNGALDNVSMRHMAWESKGAKDEVKQVWRAEVGSQGPDLIFLTIVLLLVNLYVNFGGLGPTKPCSFYFLLLISLFLFKEIKFIFLFPFYMAWTFPFHFI